MYSQGLVGHGIGCIGGFVGFTDLSLLVLNDCCIAWGSRAVIPGFLQERVLSMAHDGHLGIIRMKQWCPENVWWPSLTKDIESYVKECEPCVLTVLKAFVR